MEKEERPPHDAAVAASLSAPRRRHSAAAARQARWLTYTNAPPHTVDNRFILKGYRPQGTFRRNLRSLWQLHNETGNIWTHLIGFLIFLFLTATTWHILKPAPLDLSPRALLALEQRLFAAGKANLADLVQTVGSWERQVVALGQSRLEAVEERLRSIGRHNLEELQHLQASLRHYGQNGLHELSGMGDRLAEMGSHAVSDLEAAVHRAVAGALDARWPVRRWPVYVFTAGAMICMLTSSVCHLFGCCAAHISGMLWRFDYAGIAVLIVASFFPPVYYGFMCHPYIRAFYLLTTSLLGLSTLFVTLLDRFQRPEYVPARAAIFVGLGLWGVVPIIHGWRLNLGEEAVHEALGYDILMGVLYLLGAGLYAARVPERWKPGAFDVAFHSHQLFHIAVVVAACVHYKATQVLVAWRDATGGCPALPPTL